MGLVAFVEIRIPEVQERVADAVNNIVKHFYKPEKEVSVHGGMYIFSFYFCLIGAS